MPCNRQHPVQFDVIVFGDEPAGVMTALELHRTLRQLAGMAKPRIALLTDADPRRGLGGTLVRGGVSYLDRNQVPPDLSLIHM